MSVHPLPTPTPPELVVFEDNYAAHATERTPIVIDNGATNFRYGWATSDKPYTGLNGMAKYKDRKTNKQLLLFGDAIEADAASRLATKFTWEGDILANSEALEAGLDFSFLRLGIDADSVNHPIIMSERLATPLASRALTSELLFECYSVPAAIYCVDAPLSYAYSRRDIDLNTRDGLVISFNTASTSIIPILAGKGILNHAKRLPWGGSQAAEFFAKLLSLKYSTFNTKVTTQHASWMLQNFCSFSPSYTDTLNSLSKPVNMSAADVVIQFPFTAAVGEQKTEEQLAELAEKRREAGRRLQDQAAKSRAEKLAQKEEDLKFLLSLKAWKDKEKKGDFAARLRAEGIDSESLLDEDIKRIEASLKRARKKDEIFDDEPTEEPSFPLVDAPDSELNDDQIKEKRKQRLAKAGYEARIRAKKEKEKEREVKQELERQEQLEREADPIAWVKRARSEHAAVMERIKERKKRRAALTDRKSAASQARMKNIASLADDQPAPKKRKKGPNDDMFGQNDSDWLVYRKVVRDVYGALIHGSILGLLKNPDNPSDDEEEDLTTLAMLESKLLTHDTTFSYAETFEGISNRQSALMSAFRPKYPDGDVEGANRIHLNIERWRVPEAWFQPGMAGVDAAGLGELIEIILKGFGEDERRRLVKDVFLTGGPSVIPGLQERLTRTLRPILAPETTLKISLASDARLDAWRGMARFARTPELQQYGVTRAEYSEWGGERIKRWWGGNWNMAY